MKIEKKIRKQAKQQRDRGMQQEWKEWGKREQQELHSTAIESKVWACGNTPSRS